MVGRSVGPLLGAATAAAAAVAGTWGGESHASVAGGVQPLSPDDWVPLKLLERKELTGGDRPTHLFTFELAKGQERFPVSSCLLTRAPIGNLKDNGEQSFVMRPYTPVSAPDAEELDLAVKIYPEGKMTQFMNGMKAGDVLEFKGPIGKLPVDEAVKRKSIGMIAGGTGITPMLQMVEELFRKGYTGTVDLVYANVSPGDIMLKEEIDELAKRHGNFRVFYTVDAVPQGQSWNGGVGYVTKDVLESRMPKASKDALVMVCGPPGMMKLISGAKVSPKDQGTLTGILKDMGFNESNVFKF